MRMLRLGQALGFVLAVGCGSSPEPSGGGDPPVLAGAYYSESGGAVSWTAYRNDEYVTWSSDPACNTDGAAPPASCLRRGTFTLDVENETLTLTDAETREATERWFRIRKTQGHGSLVGGLSPKRALVESPVDLVRPGTITQFGLGDGAKGELVQEANVRELIYAACMLITLAVAPEDASRRPAPRPPPPPVVQMTDCPKKS